MFQTDDDQIAINRRTFVGAGVGSLAMVGLLTTTWATEAEEADPEVFQTNVKLKSPKKGNDKRQGDVLDSVSASIFIPKELKTIRGVLLNPFYEPTVKQSHWRAACRLWGFSLVGINLFGVKKDEQGETIVAALNELAETTRHAELQHAPLCIHGMSIGGGLSAQLSAALPERTIAAAPVCLEVGPTDDGSRGVPMITIFGERDGQQMEKLLAKVPVQRAEGARWAIATQWGRKHEWARANNLIMPFYDRMIAARFPQDASPADGPVKLRQLPEAEGWTADHTSWQQPPAKISRGADPKLCWLPDGYMAATWQSFVSYKPKLKIINPTGMGDGTKFLAYTAGKPIEVRVAIDASIASTKVELFNGDTKIAELNQDFPTGIIANPQPGIHALIAVATLADGSRAVSPLNSIVVL